jgi:transcription-repair coupling factor (superfamily II helicase)
LRSEEFPELFADRPPPPISIETAVELDADALIPADYVRQENERLNVYKRISEADSGEALDEIRSELGDRFGAPPESVDNLLAAARIRFLGRRLGLSKIVYKNNRLFLTCPTQEEYPGFYESVFREVLARLTSLDNRYVLKETKSKKVQAIVQGVTSLSDAEAIVRGLSEETVGVPE